jgi:hypothetical protein
MEGLDKGGQGPTSGGCVIEKEEEDLIDRLRQMIFTARSVVQQSCAKYTFWKIRYLLCHKINAFLIFYW